MERKEGVRGEEEGRGGRGKEGGEGVKKGGKILKQELMDHTNSGNWS